MTRVHERKFVFRWCQVRVQFVYGKFGCAGSHGDTAAIQANIAGRLQAVPRTKAGHCQTQIAAMAAHRQHDNTQLAVCVTWGDTGMTWTVFPAHQVFFRMKYHGQVAGIFWESWTSWPLKPLARPNAKRESKSQIDDYEVDLSSMRSFGRDIPLA